MSEPRPRPRHLAFAAAGLVVGLLTVHDEALALTCGTHPPDAAAQVITVGYPRDAPYRDVFIATIERILPDRGDAMTFGATLIIRVDAVLRGDLALSTREVYNPSLGLAGWVGFREGGQFLIAAGPAVVDGLGEVLSTFACAPNEEIRSPERFWELVRLSPRALLPATSVPRQWAEAPWATVGLGLLALSLGLALRRTMGRNGLVHRRDDRPPATDA